MLCVVGAAGARNIELNVLASNSQSWDQTVRDEVKLTKLSTAELNTERSKCLVPGYNLSCFLLFVSFT